MKILAPGHLLVALLLLVTADPASAFEPVLVKESIGADVNLGQPCPLNGNTNGTAANYRWYNICSGYIWLYNFTPGEGIGVLFGGPDQPAVAPGNVVKRAITYYRNVSPAYCGNVVNIFLDADFEGDGCPDSLLAQDELGNYIGLRWNCSEFGVVIPANVYHVIVRQIDDCFPDDAWPGRFATDGPLSAGCDPAGGSPRSFYYGITGTCQPWRGPTDRTDNFLTWLIVDAGVPNAMSARSWGNIKGLYR